MDELGGAPLGPEPATMGELDVNQRARLRIARLLGQVYSGLFENISAEDLIGIAAWIETGDAPPPSSAITNEFHVPVDRATVEHANRAAAKAFRDE